jgi:hypothetical protein
MECIRYYRCIRYYIRYYYIRYCIRYYCIRYYRSGRDGRAECRTESHMFAWRAPESIGAHSVELPGLAADQRH